jgi:cellulose biosynthesis protein BcsQ
VETKMNARIVCFASAKGGTGKTVLSASFAKFLSALNKKVLIVDTDASTNGLSLFYLQNLVNAKKQGRTESKKLLGIFEVTPNQLISPFKLETNIDIIPSLYVMEQTATIDPLKFRNSLEQVINRFSKSYDVILLDAQAGSDIFAQIAVELSNDVILVSEYDPVSFAGVNRLETLFSRIMPFEKRWLLYNKVLPEFAKLIGKNRIVERILPPIPWDEDVVRAFAERRLAIDTEKGNEYTIAIMRAVGALFGIEIQKEIREWKTQKADSIREPIQIQKADTEREISAFQRALADNQYRIRRLRGRTKFTILYVATVLLMSSFYAFFFLSGVINSFTLYTFIIGIVVAELGIMSIIYRNFEQRNRKKEVELSAETMMLKAKLEELMEKNKKQQTLLELDLEKLLET